VLCVVNLPLNDLAMTSEGGDFKSSKFNGRKNENIQLWYTTCKAVLNSNKVWSAVRPEEGATSGGESAKDVEAGAGAGKQLSIKR
jgi:hypothetical protein